MTTFIMMAAAAVAVCTLAWFVSARASSPAPTGVPGHAPQQLDRNDFRSPESPLLIAVFTSATCASCEQVWAEVRGFDSGSVAVQNVEVGDEPQLHARYRVDSVPLTLVCDAAGLVTLSAFGPLAPDDRATLHALVSAAL